MEIFYLRCMHFPYLHPHFCKLSLSIPLSVSFIPIPPVLYSTPFQSMRYAIQIFFSIVFENEHCVNVIQCNAIQCNGTWSSGLLATIYMGCGYLWFVFVFIVCIHPWNSSLPAFHVHRTSTHYTLHRRITCDAESDFSWGTTTNDDKTFSLHWCWVFFSSNYLYHINRSNVSSYFIEFRFLFCSIFLFLKSTKYILNDFSLILCVFHMNFSSAFRCFPSMAGHSSGPLWSMDVANKISTAARLWRLR